MAPPDTKGFWLDVGTAPGSGHIYGAAQGLGTSATVSNLPTGTIWVRLWTFWGGYQWPTDFRYTS